MKSTTGIGRFLIVLLAMVMIAGMVQMAFAQGQGMRLTPAQRADTLGKQLSLNAETVKKVEGIYEKYQKIMADKRAELQGDMDAMRAALTEIRENQSKEIVALLTKEQAVKYEEIMKQQAQRMMNRPPRNN